MTGLDALQSVQFVSKKGKRLAILSSEDWETLIEWLETLEDGQIARQALAELKAAKGNRRRAGWLEWAKVKDDLRVSSYKILASLLLPGKKSRIFLAKCGNECAKPLMPWPRIRGLRKAKLLIISTTLKLKFAESGWNDGGF